MNQMSGLHKLALAAILIILCGCSETGRLDRQLEEIDSLADTKPATAIQKLERLNREHPSNIHILKLLARANLNLPQKNYLVAATYLEDAARITVGKNDIYLQAAKQFEKAGDTHSQIRNLCLHLQVVPGDAARWLELGQILIQSNEALHLELAQQVLFSPKNQSPEAVQKDRSDLLKLLILDLQTSSSALNAFAFQAATGTGLQIVETALLPSPDFDTDAEGLLPIQLVAEPARKHIKLPSARTPPAAAGLVGKFGGEGPPGITLAVSENTLEANFPVEEPKPETTPVEEPALQEPESTPESQPIEEPSTPPTSIEDTASSVATEPEPTPESGLETPLDFLAEGHTAMKDSKFDQAAKLYWQAVLQNAEDPEVWFSLSRAFYYGKELKKAEMMALEAARRNPDNPTYVVHFLRVIRENDDPEVYLQELKRARKLFPDEPFVILELAASYETVEEDLRAARLLYREFLRKHPEHSLQDEAVKALQRLAN